MAQCCCPHDFRAVLRGEPRTGRGTDRPGSQCPCPGPILVSRLSTHPRTRTRGLRGSNTFSRIPMAPLSSQSSALLLVTGIGIALYGLYAQRQSDKGAKKRFPPGPKKLPLLGNLLDMPSHHPWETYMAWSKQYKSDILHLDIAGQSLIVLCSLEATRDLLEKRSALYSDRPRSPMVVELMGYDYNVAMMKYGDEWRANRRLMNQDFGSVAKSRQFRPAQLAATRNLLRRLLQLEETAGPTGTSEYEDWIACFRRWTAEITMKSTYGIDLLETNDPYIRIAELAVGTLSAAGVPGKYLVDAIPLLKYIPAWVPGAGFQQDARIWRDYAKDLVEVPFAETKRQMQLGTAPPSFVASKLQGLCDPHAFYNAETVRSMAGTLYLGGADTTLSAFANFILAMLANPGAMRRAQAEIDGITGGVRLPSCEDYDAGHMPYVSALIKEVLRWRNLGPIAIPHYLASEDEYRGYRIPANSIVIGNTWAILHDEATYPEPYVFKPERFLLPLPDFGLEGNPTWQPDLSAVDPESAFGYGRRICPGRHMARVSLFLTIACVLAVFDVMKARDGEGKDVEPTYEYDSGFISFPLPFNCTIRRREKLRVEDVERLLDSLRTE
ncbi:Cytochrome P450 [Mycena indigotica]|uniref:Cytochrome P450 n=1 Tax=Mycena indigotica TaxID=2126181 RepID=A0A8H6SFE2_9AGAR|nr:Cytochrome P450 [Mycena indigotica]KAF7296845.1 Cytochrome P450 [Mycena indigotica]